MIKRIIDSRLPLITYNPPKVFDLPYFKECSNSGALPVFDSEFFTGDEIKENLNKLADEGFLFGLRLNIDNREVLEYLKSHFVKNLNIIVFTYNTKADLEHFTFKDTGYRFFIEATDIELTEKLKKISPHGVIVRGNEASGKVSKYSSFIILQWYLENSRLPVFVHGGVGMHTASGIFAAGASGIVLDSQLYLAEESPVSDTFKSLLKNIEEKDTVVVGDTLKRSYRFFAKLGTKIVKDFKERESHLLDNENADEILYSEIAKDIISLGDDVKAPIQSLFYLGQDACFSKHFIIKFTKISDIITHLFENISSMLTDIDEFDPLKEDSKLAREHGTKYPVIQGPMANISDNADFAQKIYENGALPFFALGSLPPNLAENILKDGKKKVERFGAGLIGIETFNVTIRDHLDLVKKYKAPFALFAGGIPGQVKELEEAGTKAYLHTPSISMFDNAVENGCRRFIYEGCEAGGHIGSLTSLTLWELAVERAINLKDETLSELTMIFAGGISSRFASWFISGLASTLARKGVKIGVQVGTVYLFTKEILQTDAVQKRYQEIILKKNETIVTGNTVGLVSRTLSTPFSEKMLKDEHSRVKDGMPLSKRKTAFESENIGSLLAAAKGFNLSCLDKKGNVVKRFDGDTQYELGNYMVGDSLAFESKQTSISDIHNRYFGKKQGLTQVLNTLEIFSSKENQINDEIAIIGLGTMFPDANTKENFWNNIISKKYSITNIPTNRFDETLYYDPDRKAEDKSYTKLGGIVKDFVFNHEKYGYTEDKAKKLSRSQTMILETAYQAAEDAGILKKDGRIEDRYACRSAVIVATCLGNELGNDLYMKYYYPELRYHLDQIDAYKELTEEEKKTFNTSLKEILEKDNKGYDPVHGVTLNIESARIASHMGIKGVNYVLDAACATSFAALDSAMKELLSGSNDLVFVGGVNSNFSPEPLVGFSKMGALSPNGSYPFDERADGFVIGEGAGVFVLKRMKDAIRDGDHIHAVVKALGSSSDGKGKAIAAPQTKGQSLAFKRCFEKLKDDTTYSDIDYIEAHGTSTIVGDDSELTTVKHVYKTDTPIGISSIKSQIGHLLGASGVAGLSKAILAVENKTLPPNGKFKKLAEKHALEGTPYYIIDKPTDWKIDPGKTRKAAISSYGFGGINYHCIIGEYSEYYKPVKRDIFSDLSYDFNDDRIVVAGMGVVLPGANNIDEYWDKLQSGESPISSIPDSRFHNSYYADTEDDFHKIPLVKAGIVKDYKINNVKYKIPPFSSSAIDRAQFFALDAASQAIENSGLDRVLTEDNKVGVILGTIPGEQNVENVLRVRTDFINRELKNRTSVNKESLMKVADALSVRIRERYQKNTEDTIPGLLSNIITGRIANFFDCNGANFVVDGSCASSTLAFDLAAKGLKSGDYDYVITGGVDTNLYPAVMLAFSRLGLLSDKECKFFDEKASGYVMGEGAAVHVVTTYKNALKNNMPILGEMVGFSFKSSAPDHILSPSESTYRDVINTCYENIPVNKNEVTHLDVFGVSNHFLDAVEKQAIESCFDSDLYFGNVKPQFGYFKAANPAVSLAKLVLMNQHKTILPNYNYDKDTTIVKKDSILKPATDKLNMENKNSLYFASNVNGIGGNHGHMVFGTLPAWLDKSKKESIRKKETVLTIPQPVTPKTKVPGANAMYNDQNAENLPASSSGRQSITILLSGQGAQRAGMMKELYDSVKDIRSLMDQGEEIFKQQRGYSLLDMMFGDSKDINLTENTQPAIFLSSAAIYHDLKRRGFNPDCFIGHSVGEYTALYCNDVLSFEDALKLLIKRADLMKKATDAIPGRIMVVFKNAGESLTLIRESGIQDIYVTNKNSENQTGVSGKEASIDAFSSYLKNAGVMHRKLALSGAFHTPLFKSAADELKAYLDGIYFKQKDYSRIISNVTGRPYPNDIVGVKDLLIRQITSPVEFIKSIEGVYRSGKSHFIEIGPGKILINLLKNINIVNYISTPSVDPRAGELVTYNKLISELEKNGKIFSPIAARKPEPQQPVQSERTETIDDAFFKDSDDFSSFRENNQDLLDKLLYKEFMRKKKLANAEALSRFNFCLEDIVVSGVSIGLPGTANKVFASDNFDKIIRGTNMIEPLSLRDKELMADKNVVRLFKQPDGNARFVEISSTEDVIQLAGQLGYFDLNDEYGIKFDYDKAVALAFAAGIESMKDANIPLVMQYKDTSTGSRIPNGFALPEQMQETTGVIFSSVFANSDSLIEDMNRYYYHKFYVQPYGEFEKIYYHLMETVKNDEIKEQITNWFFKVKERRKEFSSYKFNRNFILNFCPLGAAHFAQFIKAKGPNINLNGACASVTESISVAEDWIRAGRCERVIIIGGEAPTTRSHNQWIGTSFLALGAGTVKKTVSEAAKPFDEDRNGTILGSGAVSLIIEREDVINNRGLKGHAQVLGTHLANSAYHALNIDVDHLAQEMKKFTTKIEHMHNLDNRDYPNRMLLMSHETFTPAKGGSADAEVKALKTCWPENYQKIVISNTKGYTGHTLGAGIEDAVLVRSMQRGEAPPIANLVKIPKEFADLNLNRDPHGDYEYGFHMAAGFGSHLAFVFFKRKYENSVNDNPVYTNWLKDITGSTNPRLTFIDNILCAEAHGEVTPQHIQKEKESPVKPVTTVETPVQVKTAAPAPKMAKSAAAPKPAILTSIKEIIAAQTGYTLDMLEDDLDLEADLGIDTVKQVEIFGKISNKFDLAVPEDLQLRDLNTIRKLKEYIEGKTESTPHETAVAPSQEQGTSQSRLDAVKAVIAEQTGYTLDMLEEDLDLEADLGIDTVKQVEIFGKISNQFDLAVPEDLQLRDLNTISKLAGYLDEKLGVEAGVPADAGTTAPAAVPAGASTEKIKELIAEQTGYTLDMLEEDLDLEADLGIDTVKQVEIFGKISSHFEFNVPEDLQLRDLNTIAKLAEYVNKETGATAQPAQEASQAPATETPSQGNHIAQVQEIIAEQTGYTLDMLEENLDLEADLGIDTVKQVEIFGKISSKFGFNVPEDLQLRDLNTIAKLADYIAGVSGPGGDDTPPEGGGKPAEVTAKDSGNELIDIQNIIAEQTGYTLEMLDPEFDLEADLGIDTVKQVEIFGKLSAKFGFNVPEDLQLRDLNTINKLKDYIISQTGGSQETPVVEKTEPKPISPVSKTVQETSAPDNEFPDPASPIKRLIIRTEESDIPKAGKNNFKGKTIIVTLDSHGFAKKVIETIKKKKGKVITLGNDKSADFKIDLTDVKKTENRIEEFKKKHPKVEGFIHLAPLDYYFSKKESKESELNVTVKSLFVMMKSLFETLDRPGNIIGTITFDSVVFPYMEGCGAIHPMFGGLTGLLKTVNKEMSDTLVKIIDFTYKQPKKNISKITDTFINELLGDDTRTEAGYKNKKRYVLTMKPSIASRNDQIISQNDTMLVTGGAGGITYEIIKKVVEKYKVNLIILDINDIYSTEKKYLAKDADQPKIMGMLKAEMKGVKPVEIKRACDRIMRVRQSFDNINYLKSLGVSVEYNCVDVTDYKAVKKAVDKYDKIDGIFHAAGMEMSQFIAKKELWSFELVVDVKVKGMQNLLKATEKRDYKYFFTFSSVTARFGNEGQVDYTSANDFLGKTLFRQKQLHPERSYKVYAWTAWSGVGMATNPTVKKVLEDRGIQFLPLEQGVKFFMSDLLDKSENEMVFSGLDYSFDRDGLLGDPENAEFPFLDNITAQTEKSVTYERVLDLNRDLFLYDHSMDGVPLFLGSTGIETMAEVATSLAGPGMKVVGLTDFSIPYGIKILKGRPKELLVSGEKDENGTYLCNISSQFKNPKGLVMGDPTLHYQGRYSLSEKPLKPMKITLPEFNPVKFKGDIETLVYNPKRLFMFGLFGTIIDINSFDGKTLVTTVEDSSDKEFFKGNKNPNFAAAPILVDAMFQTGGLLEFFTSNRTVLPYNIESMKFYRDVERHTKYYCITEKKASGDETNTYSLKLVDLKGNLYISVGRFDMVKLNKLAEEDQIINNVTF